MDKNTALDTVGLAAPVNLNPNASTVAGIRPEPVKARFKIGAIVKLKSGSAVMTVARNIGDGRCECCYYDEIQRTFAGAMFFQDMLEIGAKDA